MAHREKNCTSQFRCRKCNERHHTTLHIDERRVIKPKQKASVRSWADQVASEESDAISIYASDTGDESHSMNQPIVATEPIAETRPFRTTTQGETETRTFRPPLQHETKKASGSETRTFRPCKNKPRRSETRPFRSHQSIQHPSEGSLVTRPQTLPRHFRSGQLGAQNLLGQTLRPMIAVAPTAVVKIEAGGRLHFVRALIDVCVSTTLIATGLMHELRLPLVQMGNQRGCALCFRGKHGPSTRIMTHAVAVNDLRRLCPSASLDPGIASAYLHIKLADPHFDRSSPVRLVLGADVYADILLPGTLPTSFGPLLGQSTVFGWVLSGICKN
uniref:Peptidase aspartic putative domain-containing protein n=1 Tax=Ceratitis capitata TaxID=7213 RepID=W8AYW5_CERCA